MQNKKERKDKKWLYKKYIIERLSTGQIAIFCNCNAKTIWYWLKKYQIKIRTHSKALKGKKHSEEAKRKMSKSKIGEKNPMYGKKHLEKAKKKISETRRREKNPNWKGGRRISNGYIYVLRPKHPFSTYNGYVLEHRLIAERILRRYLREDEDVHHINGNPSDNRNCNLLICTHGYHSWLHGRMRDLYGGKENG